MKGSIGQIITPGFRHYLGVGGAALVLQAMMKSAINFREQGRWGKSGPMEELNGYDGCVNANGPWHTSRRELKTHRDHVDSICNCILLSLCSGSTATERWRKAHRVSLQAQFVFYSKGDEYGRDEERAAFDAFMALHGHRVPLSLNSLHRDVKVLCFPQLYISPKAITLEIEATSATELRVSKGCASRWAVAWLMDVEPPAWRPKLETFAEFLSRATEFYRSATPAGRHAEAA